MSLHVTPGRIVLVRLAHGWRHPAIVLTGCSDWAKQHAITVHVFDRGDLEPEELFPDLVGENLLNTGAKVARAQGFVIVDLPEVDPNDEYAVGWFFPPRGEGSR